MSKKFEGGDEMLKNFKWIEREGYYSQKIGKHEVTVERLPKLHRLSL